MTWESLTRLLNITSLYHAADCADVVLRVVGHIRLSVCQVKNDSTLIINQHKQVLVVHARKTNILKQK